MVLLCMTASCSMTEKSSSLIEEDKLYVTRIYVGNYLDYRHTEQDRYGNPDLIWITTSLDSIHGKISAFGKDCRFSAGERLYIRRVLSGTVKNGEWVYQIENSASAFYRINEYQNNNNMLVESWLGSRPENPLPYYFIPPEELAQESDDQTETTSGGN